MSSSTIHIGLDIGTTKVCCVVASVETLSNRIDIIGKGVAECEGIRRGVVTNIQKTADAIRKAVDAAQQQSGVPIERVVIGIAGDHVQSFTTRGLVTVSSATREISARDVERLLEDVRRVQIGPDRRILHMIPQDYIIDGQDGIIDPVGMSGIRLEANVLIITGGVTAIENMYRCAERAGLEVDEIVLQPLASSYAVLDEAEREVGVALIDIGGGTTDIAIFKDGVLRFTSIFAIAGQKVTDDIMTVLGIRNIEAERIKLNYGHAMAESIMRDETFQVPGIGGRTPTEVKKSVLCQIIEPRMEEIFEFALQEIHQSKLAPQLAAGIVITGGCSLVRGAEQLAARTFRMPVKIGIPAGFSMDGMAREVSNPQFATAVGLVHYAMHRAAKAPAVEETVADEPQQTAAPDAPVEQPRKKGLFDRVKSFFEEL
ncbi:MAG: cell division protein FtsA [Candidatus Kapabacteria bacterium]|nr:cell division protein FtsA [Candidatus Kapabacteria bacterium]